VIKPHDGSCIIADDIIGGWIGSMVAGWICEVILELRSFVGHPLFAGMTHQSNGF